MFNQLLFCFVLLSPAVNSRAVVRSWSELTEEELQRHRSRMEEVKRLAVKESGLICEWSLSVGDRFGNDFWSGCELNFARPSHFVPLHNEFKSTNHCPSHFLDHHYELESYHKISILHQFGTDGGSDCE